MELLNSTKRHKTVLDSSESTFFWHYMKRSFIYLLVPILSLGSIRLYIMYFGTIAGWKLTEGYITLPALLSITFNYFDSCMAAALGILLCKSILATMF